MALHHNVRVPIPNKTYQRKQNDSVYIYYYIEFFRKNGKPSNKSVNIGKLDPVSLSLIPNDHYYEYFDKGCEFIPETSETIYEGVVSIGYTAVLREIYSSLNLDSILEDNFCQLSKDILSIAGYAVKEGSIMSYIDDYMENHFCFENRNLLTSQAVSSIFSAISSSDRQKFFKDWIKKCAANDYIAYDVTSVSTYSNGIIEAEFGYNRDHDDLKQINIGMFSTTGSKLPVYYENYNGSLTDKINLIHVLKNAREVGIETVGIVMDGGFFDEERIKSMNEIVPRFTVGMPSHLDYSKELLDTYREGLYDFKNSTSFESNYARMAEYNIYGIDGRVMIGLNTMTRDLMTASLRKDIAKREKELKEKKIKKYETVLSKKRYTELFDIIPDKNGKDYEYRLNETAVHECSKNYGYFLVFTTDHEATAEDILYYYREKDVDEKMFYQLKDYMEARRLHTHTQKTTDGKLFVLFIALIMRSRLYQKLKQYKTANHMTLEKCIRKLENIQVILRKNQSPRLVKELTRQQKDLLDIFQIDINKLIDEL